MRIDIAFKLLKIVIDWEGRSRKRFISTRSVRKETIRKEISVLK